MISRDWRCLNPACGAVFHSYEPNPECTQCGNVRVAWVPGGGHVMAKAPGVDRTVRQLADQYGMSDINSPSPSRLNRAMPKVEPRTADGPVLNFMPGFSAPVSTQGLATCEPSRDHVNFKVNHGAEQAILPQQRNYPHIGASNWKNVRRVYK